MPSKSVRSVIPLGREPFYGDEGAEEAEGAIAVPHEGQKLLFSSNVVLHFTQLSRFSLRKLIQLTKLWNRIR